MVSTMVDRKIPYRDIPKMHGPSVAAAASKTDLYGTLDRIARQFQEMSSGEVRVSYSIRPEEHMDIVQLGPERGFLWFRKRTLIMHVEFPDDMSHITATYAPAIKPFAEPNLRRYGKRNWAEVRQSSGE